MRRKPTIQTNLDGEAILENSTVNKGCDRWLMAGVTARTTQSRAPADAVRTRKTVRQFNHPRDVASQQRLLAAAHFTLMRLVLETRT